MGGVDRRPGAVLGGAGQDVRVEGAVRQGHGLQLPHLQISSLLHSGQLNFTFLSPGMMCLLQPLHTGSEILGEFESKMFLADILKSPLLGIYTFLEILCFILN